jgi:hypothetical protein
MLGALSSSGIFTGKSQSRKTINVTKITLYHEPDFDARSS